MSNNTNTKSNELDAIAAPFVMGGMGLFLPTEILIVVIPLMAMGFIMLVIVAFITAAFGGNQNNRTENIGLKPRATYTEGSQLIIYRNGREVWTDKREVEL